MSQKQKLVLLLAALCIAAGSVACRRSPQEKEAAFLKRGRALFEQRDYSRALLEFRNATAAMPQDAEPYYQIGLAYLETRSYEMAVVAFRKALALNPKHAGAELKLAALMTTSWDTKVLEDAKGRLQQLLAVPENDAEALDSLAVTEWKLGKPEEATKLLDQAIGKFPGDLGSVILLARIKLSQNDAEGAEQVMIQSVASRPKSREAALTLGRLYVQLHKFDQAESAIQKALALDPKYAPALFSLALIQADGHRSSEAEQTFKRLASQNVKDYQHLYGLYLFQEGKREQGLAEFQRLAKADPGNRSARTRLLTAYVQMGKASEAEKVLAEALKRNPKDNEALLQRSQLRIRSGDLAGAEKDLDQVLHFQPNSAQARFQLADVKRRQGLGKAERGELSEVLNRDQNFLPARLALARSFILAKQSRSALTLIDQTPAAQKANLETQVERNWALLGIGNTKEARAGIDQGLRVARVPTLLVQDGLLRMQEKDYAHAQADAGEALIQDPENMPAFRLLVESSAARKQLPMAVQKTRELASQKPKSAILRFELGQSLVTAGDRAGGRQAFEAAAALDTQYASPKLALAELDAKEKRLDAARREVNAVIGSDPRNVLALKMAADIEVAMGNHPEAIAKYKSLLDVDGSNIFALNNLAYLMALQNPDEALKLAQQAVELAPDDPATRDTLGWVYYRKGLYLPAVEQLKVSLSKESTALRQFHLAMCYLKLGDQDLGQRTLADALKQDPNLTRTEQSW